MHIYKGNFCQYDKAPISLLSTTLGCCLRKAISKIDSFSKHVACLGRVNRWHSNSISKSADKTLCFDWMPQK